MFVSNAIFNDTISFFQFPHRCLYRTHPICICITQNVYALSNLHYSEHIKQDHSMRLFSNFVFTTLVRVIISSFAEMTFFLQEISSACSPHFNCVLCIAWNTHIQWISWNSIVIIALPWNKIKTPRVKISNSGEEVEEGTKWPLRPLSRNVRIRNIFPFFLFWQHKINFQMSACHLVASSSKGMCRHDRIEN